jgi:catechol 2,3-dioxygenase-like lactoylglutathione lyase family enzyme
LAARGFDQIQVRVARPASDFAEVVAFYGATLGLPVIGSFEDHDGHHGVIFGLPDASRQLEIVRTNETTASPTAGDQLVFYLGSADRVEEVAARMRQAGHEPRVSPNPYWERTAALCFLDPDGYWLVLSPEAW